MTTWRIKRVYEAPAADDGTRVLVDRVWPRGVSKEEAKLDLWLKEIAPSTELRKWFGHVPDKYPEFKKRYLQELSGNPALQQLKEMSGTVTLLYGAKDEVHNQAVVLSGLLRGQKSKN